MTDAPLDRELESMAGDPALAKAVKESLHRLSSGVAGRALAEMAREVLEGRTDLRSIARTSAYAAELTDGIDGFKRWQSDLTAEEHDAFLADARRHLAE